MTAQKVSLVCRGRSPTEDIILCLSRFALFCLSFGTNSLCTLHDCMSQAYLRFLSRERKIHPCNLENLTQGLEPGLQLNINQKRVTAESQTDILHRLSLSACHEKAMNCRSICARSPRASVFLFPCSAVTYSRTLIIADSQEPSHKHYDIKPTLFHLIFQALWMLQHPFLSVS